MNAKNTERPRWALSLALFAMAGLSLRMGTRAQESWSKLPAAFNQNLPEKLGPVSLLGALGGMRGAAADWSYIDALQYLGDNANFLGDKSFQKTYQNYREVLWLDPYFHFAVLEGCGVLVWGNRDLAHGRLLMEEAMRVDPKFERYRTYYLAMAYAEKSADHLGMLEFLKREITLPDAPEMMLRQAGNIYTKYGKRGDAIRYWQQLLDRAKERQTIDLANKELAVLLGRDR